MNPILYIIYYFCKWLIRFTTWIYYAKITVTGRPHDRSRNPCILISNHPSTMLDPLNVAIEVDAEIKFLANASLFKNPVGAWLLHQLYCIPVERHQDTGGKPLDNAASFAKASEFLANDGCLYVAPEGSSYVERRLRKLKTGTARIAFAAESANNWQLGLTILPVGLNYSDPTLFRSELHKVFGEYIPVAKFREEYEADPVNAVLCLTEAMEESLAKLIIDCEDGQQDELLRRLEVILQHEKPLPPTDMLHRSQQVLARLQAWKEADLAGYDAFSAQVFAYFKQLKSLKISDLQVAGQQNNGEAIQLAATSPLFVLGYLTHALPTFLIGKITKAINGDFHWIPTFKFAIGVLFYPVFIWGQTWLVGSLALQLGWPFWVKWAYLLAVIPIGFATAWWLGKWKFWRQNRRAAVLRSNKKEEWKTLSELREIICNMLKTA